LTWAIPVESVSPASAIDFITSPTWFDWPVIRSSCARTSLFSDTPASEFPTDSSIRPAVFFAASADRIARLRTSSATTANPRPASPARAASTAALSASRFVWNAISSIVFTIFAVASELDWIFSMAPVSRSMLCNPSPAVDRAESARPRASPACSAFDCVREAISCRLLEISSMEAACSLAPCAIAWLPLLICSAAEATASVATATCCIPSSSLPTALFRASLIRAWSPWYSPVIRAVRSPSAIRSRIVIPSLIGRVIESMTSLTPKTVLPKKPMCLDGSARKERRPSREALQRLRTSRRSASIAPMHRFRLCFIESNSPGYSSAIAGGTSPRLILSTTALAAARGAWIDWRVWFRPSTICRHAPW